MQEKLLGLSTWLKMAFENEDFGPFIEYLLERAKMDESDSSALIDLSTIYFLLGNDALAAQLQKQALQLQQVYELSTNSNHATFTVLILKTAGDLQANWPVELLMDTSRVSMKIAYVGADIPWMGELPEHDIVINAIALTEDNIPLLEATVDLFNDWPRNTINPSSSLLSTLELDSTLNNVEDLTTIAECEISNLESQNGMIHRYRAFVVGNSVTPYQVTISADINDAYQQIDLETNDKLRAQEQQLLNQFATVIEPKAQSTLINVLTTLALDCALVEFSMTKDGKVCIFLVDACPLVHDYENMDKFAYRMEYVNTIQSNMMGYLIKKSL